MIRTTITMPRDVHKNLKREAMEREITLSEIVVERTTEGLDRKDQIIVQRKKALKEIRRLTKGINLKEINYKELIEDGRRY